MIWPNWLVVVGMVLALITAISRLRLMMPLAVLAGLTIGLARGSDRLAQLSLYDRYLGGQVTIVAKVDGDPTLSHGLVAVKLTDVSIVTEETAATMAGTIWASLVNVQLEQIDRLDRIKLVGTLDEGFGAYAAVVSEATVLEIDTSDNILNDIQQSFADKLASVIPQSEAALGMGLLTGQEPNFADQLEDNFVAASLTHILVASGYNLTILVRFIRRLFTKKSRLVSLVLSTTLIWLFVLLVGSSASMDRAVLVSLISLATWYVGRHLHPVVLLSLVASLTVLVRPEQLWGDVGWYLSFASFGGVIILAPLLISGWKLIYRYLRPNVHPIIDDQIKESQLTWSAKLARKLIRLPASFGQIIIETISAQIVTWPILGFFMGQISIVGLITNVLVLPLVPLIMLTTFLTGLAALICPVVAMWLAVPATMLLNFIIQVANWGATLPGADLEFLPKPGFILIYYILLILLMVGLKLLTRHNFYLDNVVE